MAPPVPPARPIPRACESAGDTPSNSPRIRTLTGRVVSVIPNSVVRAGTIDLDHESVALSQSVGGATIAAIAIADFDGIEVGIWEMTPGVLRDVETDELFVVLSGAATVEFADGTPTLHLRSGDVVRFATGTTTVWTVSETLRRVYVVG